MLPNCATVFKTYRSRSLSRRPMRSSHFIRYPVIGYDEIRIYDYLVMTKCDSVNPPWACESPTKEAVMITRRHFMSGIAAAGLGLEAGSAAAQDFPVRPVTLIVAGPAGTS